MLARSPARESNPYRLRSHGGLSPHQGGLCRGIAQSSPPPPTPLEGRGEEMRNPGFGTSWALYLRVHGCRKAGKPPCEGGCHAPSHHRLAGHPVHTQSGAQHWQSPAVPSRFANPPYVWLSIWRPHRASNQISSRTGTITSTHFDDHTIDSETQGRRVALEILDDIRHNIRHVSSKGVEPPQKLLHAKNLM